MGDKLASHMLEMLNLGNVRVKQERMSKQLEQGEIEPR